MPMGLQLLQLPATDRFATAYRRVEEAHSEVRRRWRDPLGIRQHDRDEHDRRRPPWVIALRSGLSSRGRPRRRAALRDFIHRRVVLVCAAFKVVFADREARSAEMIRVNEDRRSRLTPSPGQYTKNSVLGTSTTSVRCHSFSPLLQYTTTCTRRSGPSSS